MNLPPSSLDSAAAASAAPAVPDSADLLPARMLNEFVYCPRLFYYEHVEGVFLHSADTKKGAAEHTRVDAGKGDLPAPAEPEDPQSEIRGLSASRFETDLKSEIGPTPPPPEAAAAETIHARSVMLGSATLGVVAKLDLVEVTLEPSPQFEISDLKSEIRRPPEAACVIPVEYKTGAPREGENGRELWPADRMQLGLQILLLRENGYRCDEGVIFYRQTRQRVRWIPTAADEAWILRGIAAARACAQGPIPPPLDHSPKCPRCSLAPICMPDETQFLQGALPEPEPPPRFLVQLNLDGFVADNGTAVAADPAALAAELSIDDPAWARLPEARLPRPAGSGEVRRLMAPDVDTKVLYVNTPGSFVSRKGEVVVVKDQGGPLADVRIKDLHQIGRASCRERVLVVV